MSGSMAGEKDVRIFVQICILKCHGGDHTKWSNWKQVTDIPDSLTSFGLYDILPRIFAHYGFYIGGFLYTWKELPLGRVHADLAEPSQIMSFSPGHNNHLGHHALRMFPAWVCPPLVDLPHDWGVAKLSRCRCALWACWDLIMFSGVFCWVEV